MRRDEPTQITFWNQAGDEHDFMLTDPKNKMLLQTALAPLSKTTFFMTFHDEGVFPVLLRDASACDVRTDHRDACRIEVTEHA